MANDTLTADEFAKKYGGHDATGQPAGGASDDFEKKYGTPAPVTAGPSEAEKKMTAPEPSFLSSVGGVLKRQGQGLVHMAGAPYYNVKEGYEQAGAPGAVAGLLKTAADPLGIQEGLVRGAVEAPARYKTYKPIVGGPGAALYAGAAPLAGATGVDVNNMESEAAKGHTKAVLAEAAVPALEVAGGAAAHEAVPAVREAVGKGIYEPPVAGTTLRGEQVHTPGAFDYGPKPRLKPWAKTGAQVAGVLGGGAAGAMLPIPVEGPLGGAYAGYRLAPSLLEAAVPEPAAWTEGRQAAKSAKFGEKALKTEAAARKEIAARPHVPTEPIMGPGEAAPVGAPTIENNPKVTLAEPGKLPTPASPEEAKFHEMFGPEYAQARDLAEWETGSPEGKPLVGNPTPFGKPPVVGEPTPPSTPENPLWSRAGKEATARGEVGGPEHEQELTSGRERQSIHLNGGEFHEALKTDPEMVQKFGPGKGKGQISNADISRSLETLTGKKMPVTDKGGPEAMGRREALATMLEAGHNPRAIYEAGKK
jgi:hypothetical protein